jgi:hypothetical protein
MRNMIYLDSIAAIVDRELNFYPLLRYSNADVSPDMTNPTPFYDVGEYVFNQMSYGDKEFFKEWSACNV